MVVVFPAPFGPTNPVTQPGRTAIDSSSTATVRPYRFVSAWVSIVASMPVDGTDGADAVASRGERCLRSRSRPVRSEARSHPRSEGEDRGSA